MDDDACDVGERRRLDAGVTAVAEQHRDDARADHHRQHHARRLAAAPEVGHEHGIEAFRRRHALQHRLRLARFRKDARQVERHADAGHLVARGAVAERVASLGSLTVDDEHRGVIEVLARELEKQIEDGVALGRLFELGACNVDGDRAAAPAQRAHRGKLGLAHERPRTAARRHRRTHRLGRLRVRRGRPDARRTRRAEPDVRRAQEMAHRRERAPARTIGHHALEEPLQPAVERHPVVACERLLDANERRDLLRDRERERERQFLLDVGGERLGYRHGQPVAIDRERREVSLHRHLGRHEPHRVGLGARELTRRRRREAERLGDDREQLRLVELADLEQVRDEVASVEDLPRESLFDLADRCDLALDDEGAQRHALAATSVARPARRVKYRSASPGRSPALGSCTPQPSRQHGSRVFSRFRW